MVAELFDREVERATLERFVRAAGESTSVGVVYGRRRVGKSFLLRHLSDAHGGAYFQALQQEEAPTLNRLGTWYGEQRDLGARVAIDSWEQALRLLLDNPGPGPQLVILDEYPYLEAGREALVRSVLQLLVDESRTSPSPRATNRLILCGSALSVMTSLLGGSEALRGRVQMQLALRPFDYRLAAAYWKVDHDPTLAFHLHAVVGGMPGYRDLLLNAGTPSKLGELGDWLAAGVLDPGHALFREDEYLLAEDRGLADRALHLSILSAVAAGERTVKGIASAVGRERTALARPLAALVMADLLTKTDDAFLRLRPLYALSEPLVHFIHSITVPDLARYEMRQWRPAWTAADARWRSAVLGPHFERLAREWTARYAEAETTGGEVSSVHHAVFSCREHRGTHELDVVAKDGKRVLLIGEAKFTNERRSLADLARLEHCRELLAHHQPRQATPMRVALFARNGGFDRRLVTEASRRDDVVLVDVDRLYHGG